MHRKENDLPQWMSVRKPYWAKTISDGNSVAIWHGECPEARLRIDLRKTNAQAFLWEKDLIRSRIGEYQRSLTELNKLYGRKAHTIPARNACFIWLGMNLIMYFLLVLRVRH